ncbi:peptidoglycan-binding protein [Peribacillus asahii]|uniref:peptidoglycan-binding protein n=1 Tax=Peribacillus asahii TaxID=228899 RepID=UPI00207A030E|nr:peptidoglycan-binding protein [Peribacillus asahii]USK58393.1 peptidoglycan-binding protein [Peribacillus asahii]
MSSVRNIIKIVYPFIIITVFFLVMFNFKHTETLSLAEEKSIKEYNDLYSKVQVGNVDEDKATNEYQINMLEQVLNESGAVRLGAEGEYVKPVQQSLGLNEDGVFSLETEKAVKDFQERYGYVADGIVGPQTWKALKGNIERKH